MLRTVARQAPLSMEILRARLLEWVATPSSKGSYWSRDPADPGIEPAPPVAPMLTGGFFFYHWTIWEAIPPLVAGIEISVSGLKRLNELVCVKCLKHVWSIVSTQRLLDLIISIEFLIDT